MLVADRCRVVSTAYVNSETLNDFYSILSIAKYNNNSKIAEHVVVLSTSRTFF